MEEMEILPPDTEIPEGGLPRPPQEMEISDALTLAWPSLPFMRIMVRVLFITIRGKYG